MPATTKTLGDLHEKLANVMIKKLDIGDVTAADMGAIRSFLSDNGIQAVGDNAAVTVLASKVKNSLPFPVKNQDPGEQDDDAMVSGGG